MIDEEFEFLLTQYMDGTLPVDEAAAFFEELAKHPAALEMLDEYRRLDLMLKAQPSEAINWDGLAEDISTQIDEAGRSRLRIFVSSPMRIALAASVAIAIGVAGFLGVHSPNGKSIGPGIPQAIAQIAGPTAEIATAPAVAEIEIGPGPTLASDQDASYHYADLLPKESRVIIASGETTRQDDRTLPF